MGAPCGMGFVFTVGRNEITVFALVFGSLGMMDSTSPLKVLAVGSLVNLVGDIFLCSFLGYGIAGAAWATIVSQVCHSSVSLQSSTILAFHFSSFILLLLDAKQHQTYTRSHWGQGLVRKYSGLFLIVHVGGYHCSHLKREWWAGFLSGSVELVFM